MNDTGTCIIAIAQFIETEYRVAIPGPATFHGVDEASHHDGKGKEGDIELLEELAEAIKDASQCGLGQSLSNPVLSSLKHFKEEYEEHVKNKRCPAGVCKALISFDIDKETCTGCRLCAKKCPQDAIVGEAKEPHAIDLGKCIKCGVCVDVCKFEAVSVT